jgi:signal transduction histidine kinase
MMADTVPELIRADGCYVTLWDEEHKHFVLAAAHSSIPDSTNESAVEPGEATLTELALNKGSAQLVEDFDQFPNIKRYLPEGYQVSAVVVLPLRTNERVLGALILVYEKPFVFSDDYLTWAGQAANLVALSIDKAKAYADLEKRVEERTGELRELSIRLLELSRLKDEFVSNVSHELRTPITSIKLYHQLLRQRPERYAIYLERLDRESERLEFIVEDLLYLSRMEQGQLPFNSVSADLNQLVDMYFVDRKLLIEKEGHRLVIELANALPTVMVDQMLMERVLNILVNNALNYTSQGERITVSTGTDGEWVLLRVSDTGPGIPPGEITHLFERFFRGEASRRANVPGTGLGLAIAKEIVDRHEGQINVSSTPGEGTTFTIRLPAADKK